jgi:hypothetical protein
MHYDTTQGRQLRGRGGAGLQQVACFFQHMAVWGRHAVAVGVEVKLAAACCGTVAVCSSCNSRHSSTACLAAAGWPTTKGVLLLSVQLKRGER